MKKKIIGFVLLLLAIVFSYSSVSFAESLETEGIKEIQKGQIGKKIEKSSRGDSGEFIHNNGKPIQNEITDSDEQKLFAIYKETINGEDHEKYYFANIDELPINEFNDIKKDVKKEKEKIKAKGKVSKSTTTSSDYSINSATTMAATAASSYWKTYSWTAYGTHLYDGKRYKLGVYSSNNNFVRTTTSANVDGRVSSIWDIHAFNSYSKERPVTGLTTRMDVNYSAQKLLSYGPSSDAGFNVPISLTSITNPKSWSFGIGNSTINDQSSISGKYGQWSYALSTLAPSPYNTEPGMRVSNYSGDFSLRLSHQVRAGTFGNYSTGTVYIYLADK